MMPPTSRFAIDGAGRMPLTFPLGLYRRFPSCAAVYLPILKVHCLFASLSWSSAPQTTSIMLPAHSHGIRPDVEPGHSPGGSDISNEISKDGFPNEKAEILQAETLPREHTKWKVSRTGDGDVAMGLFSTPTELHEPATPEEMTKLERKIDFMILPYLAVCYAFFYIDKTTLSYAAIFGIRKDLHLVGTQYNWLSSAFYFGFLIWALPTNFLLQRLPVGRYLGFNIFLWGALLMCQAACNSFETLTVLRVLAGAAEAASDPSFMLITSMWYTRRQQPVRMGLWYTANGFGIALGGLLGYAIGHIKGQLPSWKYEFIIIGALCSCWGIVMFIFLPDSPVTAKGMSLREKRLTVERLRDNQTGVEVDHDPPFLDGSSLTDIYFDRTNTSKCTSYAKHSPIRRRICFSCLELCVMCQTVAYLISVSSKHVIRHR
jgi:Major Facilitator Superfamily